jgi:SP family general alpha glucoside:H+ symporter-like MFS transporter
MASLADKKLHGATEHRENIHTRSHSNTVSSSSTTDTIGAPTITKFDSTNTMLERSASVVEANNDAERSMTLREGLRMYPKAITWSVLLSMTLIMEGFSTILVPNLFSMGPFRRQFGSVQSNGRYELSADWQSALVNGGLVGQIVGLFATGTLAERIGYRYTLMVGLVAMTWFILVPFFATSKVVLLIGQCILGMPWGMFQCICTVYAADVCPVALRAYLTTYVSIRVLGPQMREVAKACLLTKFQLRKRLLGPRPTHRLHRAARHDLRCIRLVLPYSLRPPMDIPHPNLHRCILRARVALVAYPTEPLRRCEEESTSPPHKTRNAIRCLVRCEDRWRA